MVFNCTPPNLCAGEVLGVMSSENAFTATVCVVNAYLQSHNCPLEKLPALILRVHGALCTVRGEVVADRGSPDEVAPLFANAPAVPVNQSVTNEYVICLEDGVRVKSLKRYLRRFGLTPDQYRQRWSLPSTYPMVAPALSEKRSAVARQTRPHLKRKQQNIAQTAKSKD